MASSTNSTICTYFDYILNKTVTLPCNNVPGSPNLLNGQLQWSNYGYFLNHPATYFFLSFYSFLCVVQILLGVYWRTWWTLPTPALGTLVEVIGWIGRLISIKTFFWETNYGGFWSYDFNSFVIQICCLVIAPTFFSAANYVLLGQLLSVTDPLYSSLDIRSIRVIFIVADVMCLLVQAGGGAWAGTVMGQGDYGAYLMTGGVGLQLIVTIFFLGVFIEWLHRWRLDRPVRRQRQPFPGKKAKRARRLQASNTDSLRAVPLVDSTRVPTAEGSVVNSDKELPTTPGVMPSREIQLHGARREARGNGRVGWMAVMIAFSSFLIVVRSVYRTIELSNGWQGSIATNEPLFLGLDAAMMSLLVLSYSIIHPGLALGRPYF